MPTGYTATIKPDTTLREFVLTCARAMGALIMMRDDPSDAPIPDEFAPSSFYLESLEKEKAELARLQAMTPGDVEIAMMAERKAAEERVEKYRQESAETLAKYQRMLHMVEDWTPPTAEHQGLKSFMVDQINQSIEFDTWTEESLRRMAAPEQGTAQEWQCKKIAAAHESIARYAGEWAKEQARAAGRSKWVQALKAALP